MERFGWKANDYADALRLMAKQNGVAAARSEDGRWRVKQPAPTRPTAHQTRTPSGVFHFPA